MGSGTKSLLSILVLNSRLKTNSCLLCIVHHTGGRETAVSCCNICPNSRLYLLLAMGDRTCDSSDVCGTRGPPRSSHGACVPAGRAVRSEGSWSYRNLSNRRYIRTIKGSLFTRPNCIRTIVSAPTCPSTLPHRLPQPLSSCSQPLSRPVKQRLKYNKYYCALKYQIIMPWNPK